MATLGHSPNFCGVLSDTKRIIGTNSGRFSVLSILFLLPLSIAFILFPSSLIGITTPSGPNSITVDYQQKSPRVVTRAYGIFVIYFSVFPIASITYGTFLGFYNRPVSFISAVKSIMFSYFRIFPTVIAFENLSILVFGILVGLVRKRLVILVIDFDYGSNYLVGFVISILILVVIVYLQVEWSLVYAVVVIESKWGFTALKRSSYLLRGMKWVALSIMLYYGILPWVLAVFSSTLLVYLGGINGGWGAILEFVFCSYLLTMMMLRCVVANTVLYVYCLALRGEKGLEIAEKFDGRLHHELAF